MKLSFSSKLGLYMCFLNFSPDISQNCLSFFYMAGNSKNGDKSDEESHSLMVLMSWVGHVCCVLALNFLVSTCVLSPEIHKILLFFFWGSVLQVISKLDFTEFSELREI